MFKTSLKYKNTRTSNCQGFLLTFHGVQSNTHGHNHDHDHDHRSDHIWLLDPPLPLFCRSNDDRSRNGHTRGRVRSSVHILEQGQPPPQLLPPPLFCPSNDDRIRNGHTHGHVRSSVHILGPLPLLFFQGLGQVVEQPPC